MTNISDLYNHVNELIKTDIDNLLVDMIEYGTPVSGETVTINLEVMESRSGFTHGMGLFLFDTETTYTDFDDLRSNVGYSAFIPLQNGVMGSTDGFEHQFVFNNVTPSEYYVVLVDYDDDNLPIFREGSTSNQLGYLGTDSENLDYLNLMPYQNYAGQPVIEVVANGNNIWYARTDY